MVYSLMLTCHACNVEPYAYLLHVLTELPQRAPDADITCLLPFKLRETANGYAAIALIDRAHSFDRAVNVWRIERLPKTSLPNKAVWTR
jgi:hypothetical protein